MFSILSSRESWSKGHVQDPEALMRLLVLLQRKEAERSLADDLEETDDEEEAQD